MVCFIFTLLALHKSNILIPFFLFLNVTFTLSLSVSIALLHVWLLGVQVFRAFPCPRLVVLSKWLPLYVLI